MSCAMATSTTLTPPCLPAAIVFGATGAIGSAVTRALLVRRPRGEVYARSRSADHQPPPGAVPFRFDVPLEPSIAAVARTFPVPELVFVTTGLLHQGCSGIERIRQIEVRAFEKVQKAMQRISAERDFAHPTD